MLAKELSKVLDSLPEEVELLTCKFEFGDRPPVTVHIGDNADKIRACIERKAAKANRIYPINDIVCVVCKAFGITEKEIKGKGRYKTVARARQILCYIIRKHTDLSLSDIAQFIYGHDDHTTVLYHIRRVTELLYVNDIQALEMVLYIENALTTLHPPLPLP